MSDALLPYYDRELNAIRALAREFATAHPKVAGRLRLSEDAADDPHVARLLEGVAFLAARVHHRLDDEFPELTDALLGVLYPHYLAPVPSCAIVQFHCKPDLKKSCHAYPVGICRSIPNRSVAKRAAFAPRIRSRCGRWRWKVSGCPDCRSRRLPTPRGQRGRRAAHRARNACRPKRLSRASASIGCASSCARRPIFRCRCMSCCAGTQSASHSRMARMTPDPVLIPASAIQPVGFAAEEALFPWPARSFAGFRLLSEYFAFPEKFLFLDFGGLDAKTLISGGNRMEIFVYLDRSVPELERAVGNDALALGLRADCQPVSANAASR